MMWLWFWEMKRIVPSHLLDLSKTILPGVKTVICTDGVHSKLQYQLAELNTDRSLFLSLREQSMKIKKIEVEIYNTTDAVIAISEADARHIKGLHVDVRPNVHIVSFVSSPWEHRDELYSGNTSWAARKNIVFEGRGKSESDVAALTWYLENTAYHVDRGIPSVKCFVIGTGWEEFKLRNDNHTMFRQFDFLGKLTADETAKIIESSRVFISPIVASTGIVAKNVEALLRGIPLVTTPAGATGLCKECDNVLLQSPLDPEHSPDTVPLLIGRDMYDFTVKVKRFYYKEKAWNKYREQGKKHAISWFGRARSIQGLDKALISLKENRS